VRRTGATFRPLKEKDLWIGFGIAYSNELPRPGMDVLLQLIRRKLKGRRPGGD
jgi:hypothetical protein